jgi:hypothetical protein
MQKYSEFLISLYSITTYPTIEADACLQQFINKIEPLWKTNLLFKLLLVSNLQFLQLFAELL